MLKSHGGTLYKTRIDLHVDKSLESHDVLGKSQFGLSTGPQRGDYQWIQFWRKLDEPSLSHVSPDC